MSNSASTLAQPATPCKPQAYYAHLCDEPGILAKVNGKLYFITEEDHQIMDFEPEMTNFCTVLGACSIADTQMILDRLRGGAARLCTSRAQEVQ